MAFWETAASMIAAFGGLTGFAAFYQARLAHKSENTKTKQQAATSHEEITQRQQQELNADEQKFRADLAAFLKEQREYNEKVTREAGELGSKYHQLQRDYGVLLARVERQALRIQDITVIQAQADYWKAQAQKTQVDLETALVELNKAREEAELWRGKSDAMQLQIVQLSSEIDQLKTQMQLQEAEIETLMKAANGGSTP